MRNIELHTIESVDDLALAEIAGLDIGDNEICESCTTEVGVVDSRNFEPFVYCLDDESEWIVCLDCADPIL